MRLKRAGVLVLSTGKHRHGAPICATRFQSRIFSKLHGEGNRTNSYFSVAASGLIVMPEKHAVRDAERRTSLKSSLVVVAVNTQMQALIMRKLPMRYALIVGVLLFTASAVDVRASADLGYQPNSNPLDRLRAAQSVAVDEDKKILIIAGGDWRSWCHILDKFLSSNDDVNAALHDAFEV